MAKTELEVRTKRFALDLIDLVERSSGWKGRGCRWPSVVALRNFDRGELS